MTEGTYEYECMRAELLGVEKPDHDEFLRRQKEQLAEAIEDERIDAENLKEAEIENDDLKSTAGKLDELNNLLSLTQKKINNFKFRCGSMTNYVRTRLGSLSRGGSDASSDLIRDGEHETAKILDAAQDEKRDEHDMDDSGPQSPEKPTKSDLGRALDRHVDTLDLLLEKSESAQYAMLEQRKQMQRYLKK